MGVRGAARVMGVRDGGGKAALGDGPHPSPRPSHLPLASQPPPHPPCFSLRLSVQRAVSCDAWPSGALGAGRGKTDNPSEDERGLVSLKCLHKSQPSHVVGHLGPLHRCASAALRVPAAARGLCYAEGMAPEAADAAGGGPLWPPRSGAYLRPYTYMCVYAALSLRLARRHTPQPLHGPARTCTDSHGSHTAHTTRKSQ